MNRVLRRLYTEERKRQQEETGLGLLKEYDEEPEFGFARSFDWDEC
jgi:hypothetical protein